MNSIGRALVVVAMAAGFNLVSGVVPARAAEEGPPAGSAAAGEFGQGEVPVPVQLEQLQQKYRDKKDAYDRLQQEFETEKAKWRVALLKAEAEKDDLKRTLKELEASYAERLKSERYTIESLGAKLGVTTKLLQEAAALVRDVDTLTKQIHELDAQRAHRLQQLLLLTRSQKSSEAEKTGTQKSPEAEKEDPWGPAGEPPVVDGRVLSVRPDGLIEISVGAKHRLKKGHRLEIFDEAHGKPSWMARVELTEVGPEKSTGKVIVAYPFERIEEGDRAVRKISGSSGDPLREVRNPFAAPAGKKPDETGRPPKAP